MEQGTEGNIGKNDTPLFLCFIGAVLVLQFFDLLRKIFCKNV